MITLNCTGYSVNQKLKWYSRFCLMNVITQCNDILEDTCLEKIISRWELNHVMRCHGMIFNKVSANFPVQQI
jgi:hypothetical protein